ncbi:MAG: hypothetical protein AB1644_10670 [Candidatus Zixiibacteriota bacterium]
MKIVKHPDRTELLKAVADRTPTVLSHLKSCAACRELFELLGAYPVAGELALTSAPSAWIDRAVELARTSAPSEVVRRLLARLSFDSWSLPAAVGVRSLATETERRLRFDTELLTFDLRAEKQSQGWDFIAQVAEKTSQASHIELRAGRTVIPVDGRGFFQWSSKRPTARLTLRVDDMLIELPEVTWKTKNRT